MFHACSFRVSHLGSLRVRFRDSDNLGQAEICQGRDQVVLYLAVVFNERYAKFRRACCLRVKLTAPIAESYG